jgi:hypothetical protein
MREVHKALASKPHPNDERPLPSPADDLAQLLAAVLAYRPQTQPPAPGLPAPLARPSAPPPSPVAQGAGVGAGS